MGNTAEHIWRGVEADLELEHQPWLQEVLGEEYEGWVGGIQAVLTYLTERPAMAVLDKVKGPKKMIGWMFDEMIEAWTAESKQDKQMEYADVMVFGILIGALHWQEMNEWQQLLVTAGIKFAAWRLQALAGSVGEGNQILEYVASEKDAENYPADHFQLIPDEDVGTMVIRVGEEITNLHRLRRQSSQTTAVMGDD